MLSRYLFPVFSLLPIGCASTVSTVNETSTARVSDVTEINVRPIDNGVVCELRRVTGSKITERVCYRRDADNAMQDHDQRVLLDEINESSRREINQSSMREAARSTR